MKKIKCVIWDLDGTVWNGTLLEGDELVLKDGIVDIIKELDRRGILQSIASKNEHDQAMEKLREFKLDEYFIHPQINWNSKGSSIQNLAEVLNLSTDTFAFVDDRDVERGEVLHMNPNVLCIDALDYKEILDMERMNPDYITADAANRRLLYKDEIERKTAETSFVGSTEEFLSSLNMELKISPVQEGDLERVEELTLRTSQMNSTGYTYSMDELRGLIDSKDHIFLIVELTDKFGYYGKIGLVLIEKSGEDYVLKLLILSCRVMTKGIGSTLLIYLIKLAEKDGKKLKAEFLETDRNRSMYITYKLMGFEEIEQEDNKYLLEYNSSTPRDFPEYISIVDC